MEVVDPLLEVAQRPLVGGADLNCQGNVRLVRDDAVLVLGVEDDGVPADLLQAVDQLVEAIDLHGGGGHVDALGFEVLGLRRLGTGRHGGSDHGGGNEQCGDGSVNLKSHRAPLHERECELEPKHPLYRIGGGASSQWEDHTTE
ncbi:hypothetical protein D3C86_1859210 [compost metagenome]